MLADFILSLPTWHLTRTFGLISYFLLFLGIILGIVYSLPTVKAEFKKAAYKGHRLFTVIAFIIGLLHGFLLVVDSYMPFGWTELLIPFTATFRPLWTGLGTITLFGMLILLFTSDFRNKIRRSVWYLIHLLSYPLYWLAFFHGFALGTDMKKPIIVLFYLLSAVIVAVLTSVRLRNVGS